MWYLRSDEFYSIFLIVTVVLILRRNFLGGNLELEPGSLIHSLTEERVGQAYYNSGPARTLQTFPLEKMTNGREIN